MKKIHMKKNPFLLLFISFALICCLALSVLFISIIQSSLSEQKELYYNNKLEVVLKDFDTQIENFETMSFRYSTNPKYKYSVLSSKKYNENILLEDFKTYRYSSPLTEELFLYYGETNIFHIMGNTICLDVYLKSFPASDQEILTEALSETLKDPSLETHVIPTDNTIFILTPFKAGFGKDAHIALLAGMIPFEQFEQRLQIVSGGLSGNISLYKSGLPIYSNSDMICTDKTRNVLSASLQDGKYTIYYQPASESFLSKQLVLEAMLIIMDILLLMIIAQIFAQRAFQPIQNIRAKYGSEDTAKNCDVPNAFAEIDGIISNALEHSICAAKQVEQKQEQLKKQLLNQLLNGICPPEILAYLDALSISLPGPYYFVISLSLPKKYIDSDFFSSLQKDLEQFPSANNQENLCTVCDDKLLQLWVICSLKDNSAKDRVVDYVKEVAESYSQDFFLGIGKVYESLQKISASWLESLDNLTNTTIASDLLDKNINPDSLDLQLLETALSTGSVENSMKWLENYVKSQEQAHLSFLMQQYAFSEFTGKISRLSRINNITLSNQNISLLISAKNISGFYEAAKEIILEYCEKFQLRIDSLKDHQNYLICQYIQDHFMEYDISIEIIADNLNVSAAQVRDAVLKSTGKMYKDYLVCLRMEYAKTLLQKGTMSVAEVSNAVGYSSVSYFIRLFKNTQGITPAKYSK